VPTDREPQPTNIATVEPVESIESTRALVGKGGGIAARQTVLTLGLRGELDVRRIAGRLVVTRASIEVYRARYAHTAEDLQAASG
jgi:hypothetical protein